MICCDCGHAAGRHHRGRCIGRGADCSCTATPQQIVDRAATIAFETAVALIGDINSTELNRLYDSLFPAER